MGLPGFLRDDHEHEHCGNERDYRAPFEQSDKTRIIAGVPADLARLVLVGDRVDVHFASLFLSSGWRA
jgi:hypothetical protein